MVDVEGLGQILERSASIGGHGTSQIRVRRHYDDRQCGTCFVDPLQKIKPRHARHADIGDEHIRRFALERIEDRFGRLEGARRHAAIAQRAFQHPTDRGVIIDEPNMQCRIHDASESGNSRVKTVRPGSLSNSMSPPCRVTRS
jgi:hypothetical protein